MNSSGFDESAESGHSQSPQQFRESILCQKAILNTIPDIAWLKDREGRYIFVNEPFAEACGVVAADLVGKTDYDIWPKELAEVYGSGDAEIVRTAKGRHVEERLVGADGRERWLEIIKTPIIDCDGTVVGTTGIVRDLTERKQTEAKLLHVTRLYAFLSQINQAIFRTRDRNELFWTICRVAIEFGQFRMAWIGLVDETGEVKPFTSAGHEDGYLASISITREKTPLGKGPTGSALREGSIIACDDIAADPRMLPWRAEALKRGYRSSASVPFRLKGTVIGTLNLYAAEAGFFTVDEQKLLEAVGTEISYALDALEAEQERRKAEETLRESEQRHRGFFESAAVALAIVDMDGFVVAANETDCRFLGYSHTELIGMHFAQFTYPEDLEVDLQLFRSLMDGQREQYETEKRYLRKDGEVVWGRLAVSLIRNSEGLPLYTLVACVDITERKKTEEALLESEEKFRAVFDSASDGILLVDPETREFVFGNATIARMLDLEQDDIPALRVEQIHPADSLETVLRGFKKAVQGEPLIENIPVLRRDGSVFFADIATSWVRLKGKVYMAGFFRDTTERRRMEAALKESERKYRELFDSATDAIFIMDLDGNFLDVNKTAYTRLGYAKEEMMSLPISRLDPPEFAERIPERLAQITEHGEAVFESAHIRKDGTVMPVEVNARLLDYEGRKVYFSSIRDITDRKKTEQERLELERRLLHAQKLESLGILAGGIAHDFNNLLMAILGNLDLALLSISPSSPARGNIEQSLQAIRRATDLTNQMLAYSGRGSFIIAPVNMNELVEENARLFRAAIARTSTLNLQLGQQLPFIEADAGQVQQVIMNLITNASDAIGDKPGVITLTTGVVDCDAEHLKESRIKDVPWPGRFVFVEVADTGIGMDEDTQQRLFDPFFTTKDTGRGLGMSAILGIMRGHGGAVFVNSVKGYGTTIRVIFPASEKAGAAKEVCVGTHTVRSGLTSLNGTVLVVDDEEAVRSVCRQMVEYLGAAVLTAADGREALSIFQERAAEISLVILDLSMPMMDGMTTLRELLRIKSDAKVILSSGFDRQDALRGFPATGIAGFIQKPYTVDKLRLVLQDVLKDDSRCS